MLDSVMAILRGRSKQLDRDYRSLPSSDDDQNEVLEREGEDSNPRGSGNDQAIYLAFWTIGAGTILGWSALISIFPFLTSLYPAHSRIGQNLPSLLSTVYCLGQLFFLGTAQRAVGRSSPTPRLRWSLSLLLFTFIVTTFPILSLILPFLSGSSSSASLITPLILLVTLTLNFSTSYFQSSVLALASLWGSTEVLATMSGQGGVAVLISLAQVSLAIVGALKGVPTQPGDGSGQEGWEEGSEASTLAAVGLWALGSGGVALCMLALRYLRNHPTYTVIVDRAIHTGSLRDIQGDDEDPHSKAMGNGSSWQRTKSVLRKNRLLYLAVGWDFAVTLAVFPAITSLIVSTQNPPPRLLRPDVFIPLHFLIFNIGDYLGRTYLPSYPPLLITSHPRVLLLSLFRTLFIPLFLGCNLSTRIGSPWIGSDVLYLLILLAFGASNGYLGSLSIIVSSTPALNARLEEHEKDVAGTLGVFCLMAGLSVGSMSSFGVNWAVRA